MHFLSMHLLFVAALLPALILTSTCPAGSTSNEGSTPHFLTPRPRRSNSDEGCESVEL